MYNEQSKGIVFQAVMLTIAVAACMMLVYRTGIIKVTEKFKVAVVSATAGIMLFYLATIILRLFSIEMPFIHDTGAIGIGFSLLVIGLAALNLILDFDLIDRGVQEGAPRYLEWFAAFALMVTLVWLYLEMLRLLSKLNRR